jgi:hypothetical protein
LAHATVLGAGAAVLVRAKLSTWFLTGYQCREKSAKNGAKNSLPTLQMVHSLRATHITKGRILQCLLILTTVG